MIDTKTITVAFTDRFGASPTLVGRAPGRVNLIGEHTDYNGGWVLPIAIDRDAAVAARPRNDRLLHIYAVLTESDATLDLDQLKRGDAGWPSYAAGMAAMLEQYGMKLRGADLLVMGDVPTGSGLSSSAAFEVALGTTYAALAGASVPSVTLARLAQRTENEWVGVNSGIMDQMISVLGQQNHALLIDCRDYSTQPIPMPADVRVVVCDSKKSRTLAGSAYNVRRAQCEAAVAALRSALPDIRSLRDVTSADLEAHADLLDPVVYKRARHVVTEDERVIDSVGALRSDDLSRFGQLMNLSHNSLRDDYEVSSQELDSLVNAAREVEGTYGSRLTGAGFGGCTVSLVAPEAVDRFTSHVAERYQSRTGLTPDIYVCTPSSGTSFRTL